MSRPLTELGTSSGLFLAIEAFQDYVVRKYESRSSTWPHSKNAIAKVAASLSDELDLVRAPVDLAPVLKLFAVTVRVSSGIGNRLRGQLHPSSDGFQVIIPSTTNWNNNEQSRFTVAHEIGHCLFFSLTSRTVSRLVPYQSADSDGGRREEGLCDTFASHLLVPDDLVYRVESLGEILRRSLRLVVTPDVLIRRALYDFHYLEDSVIYAIRLAPKTTVSVFRGANCKNSRHLPSKRGIELLIKSSSLESLVETLRSNLVFRQAEFAFFKNRTLYVRIHDQCR